MKIISYKTSEKSRIECKVEGLTVRQGSIIFLRMDRKFKRKRKQEFSVQELNAQ